MLCHIVGIFPLRVQAPMNSAVSAQSAVMFAVAPPGQILSSRHGISSSGAVPSGIALSMK